MEISPTTGAQRELARFDPGPDRDLMPGAGLAYVDGRLITALVTGTGFEIAEIDPTDAAFRSVDTDFPAGATAHDGQLITVCDFFSHFCVYDTFQDLIDGRPRRQIPNIGTWSYVVNILGNEAYVTDHAHQDITVIDTRTGDPLRTLTLEDYDDWTSGLSVTGDKLIVLNTSDPGVVRVISFDRLTGSRLHEVNLEGGYAQWSGLWCSAPGPTLSE